MIIIFFADQTKRPNSTKQPSANGQAYDVILKEGCSIERPVIGLKWPGSGSPVSYNAARIAVFHRWYTVENWTFEDRIWWATLAVDVLATYKTEIGASTKYILRSASDSDDDVLDTIYPAKGVQHSAMTFLLNTPAWARTYSAGRFVVGITGQGNTFASGGVGYIVCTPSQFQSLLDGAYTGADSLWPLDLGPTIGEAMAVYGKKLQQSLQKPYQYINSVTWVPFVPKTSGSTTVTLGKISTGVTCDTLATPITEFLWTETLNSQPAGAGTPVWKNIAPYARYVLQIPPFGTHDLDSTLLPGKTTLQFELHVDVTNGEAHLDVNASGGGGVTPLISISAKMGINIPIAGIVTDQAGFLGSVVGAVGSLAGAIIAPSAGSITGAASGIGNAVQSAQPYVVGGGQPGGGLAALNGQQAITYIVYEPVDEDNTEHGRPLCKVDQISNYSGYLMLADGDVEIPGTAAERAQVASLLTGGFFYE